MKSFIIILLLIIPSILSAIALSNHEPAPVTQPCGDDKDDRTEIKLITKYIPCLGGWCKRSN